MTNLLWVILLTAVLFVPIYLVLKCGLYLAQRYVPEARGLLDTAIDPILFFPAGAFALVIALLFGPH